VLISLDVIAAPPYDTDDGAAENDMSMSWSLSLSSSTVVAIDGARLRRDLSRGTTSPCHVETFKQPREIEEDLWWLKLKWRIILQNS